MTDIQVLLVERDLWVSVVGVETAPVIKYVKNTETKPTINPGLSFAEKS